MNKQIFKILGIVLGVGSFFLLSFSVQEKTPKEYSIVQRWDLPDILEEVSGIEWIDDKTIACVQDEKGIIFIYDLQNSKIKEKIKFGRGGDYEGITVLNDDAFILRSDGMIVQVKNFRNNPKIKNIKTDLMNRKGLDVEGLSTDEGNDRLLLAIKSKKNGDKSYKGIYSFNPATEELIKEPVYKLQLNSDFFRELEGDPEEKFIPSELEINPKTGEIYILDGTNPKLLIAGRNAEPKVLYFLDKEDFSKPEGLTFSPDGTLYISNEAGDDQSANILRVNLNN